MRSDPGMVLDHARWLRHLDRTADALAIWQSVGEAAQRNAPRDELGAFWTERNLLARRLLRDGNAAGAYAVAPGHGQITPEQMLDAEFLAGFIALRRLNDPTAAARHFSTLAGLSNSAITQGRAHYWLGRTAAVTGRDARPEYQRAADWPTTFYGQLAALALGDDAARLGQRINALRDPSYTREQVLAFTDREVVRAAAMLVAWNDPHRARAFLLRMDELAPDPADRALTARLALGLGLPDTAVFVARRMGRDGMALPEAGWPIAAEPPDGPVDPALALGLIRQESSFDIGAVSPSGARGLMQLMPPTAKAVAKQAGIPTSLVSLTADPAHNMRLGTTYLREMLDRFDNSLPLAVAAYNAGPHRVDQWLPENGDPRTGPIDMLDSIELIPLNETRNYVQRVLENVVIYGRGAARARQPCSRNGRNSLSAFRLGWSTALRPRMAGRRCTRTAALHARHRADFRRLRGVCACSRRGSTRRGPRLSRSRSIGPVARHRALCAGGLRARCARHLRCIASAPGGGHRHQLRRAAQHGPRRRTSIAVPRGRDEWCRARTRQRGHRLRPAFHRP